MADRCPLNLDKPCPTVRTVGDLTARHLGRTIRVDNLLAPGNDWDAARVSATGKLVSMRMPGISHRVPVAIIELSGNARFHDRLTLDNPCEVIE